MEKNKYLHDNEKWNEFIGSKIININNDNTKFLKIKNVSRYNKTLQILSQNSLRYKSFGNIPWYEQFSKYIARSKKYKNI